MSRNYKYRYKYKYLYALLDQELHKELRGISITNGCKWELFI